MGHFDLAGVISTALVIYSIILHEIAHGYAALKFGDETAREAGRITLDPAPHVDPIGTILFPLVQWVTTGSVYLGWAKGVPVVTQNLEPRVAGEIVVAVAGVFVNLLIAIAMAFALGFVELWDATTGRPTFLFTVLGGVMFTNVALLVFNLVPIPPLDGSHVMKHFLPADIGERYERIGFNGTVLLLVLISSGALNKITDPAIMTVTDLLFRQITFRLQAAL